MSKAPVISMDELEAQLRDLGAKQPEGFSIAEMAEQIGMSEFWCRQKVKKLIQAGKAQFNGRKPAKMMDKRRYHAPVYVLIGGK